MDYQAVFKRYELKYLLTMEQKQRVLAAMEPYMRRDQYGRTTIRNLYFDTDNYRLIRHSIEKPAYKEKLRIRSYRQADGTTPVFVELKKKYQTVVYKRRVEMTQEEALQWVCDGAAPPDSQIGAEIAYFLDFYRQLRPVVFLSYEREAYYCCRGGDFRVTFDEQILARREGLSLDLPAGGTPLLKENLCLMEIKTAGGIPLWMTKVLSREKLYKTSFSKYGTAYEKMIFPNYQGGNLYA